MPAEKYPGDQYIKDMISDQGYFKKDANGNTLIGKDIQIDGESVGNFVVADNAIITDSHNNILNAKNVIIDKASGCTANGADHTIKGNGTSANYCCVEGDAHWSEGYTAHTSGYGNVNCGNYGKISGNNNRIGIKGQPNKLEACSIDGNNCEIDGVEANGGRGKNNHAIGSFIRIKGTNITVIGDNSDGRVFTIPGVYILNQQ